MFPEEETTSACGESGTWVSRRRWGRAGFGGVGGVGSRGGILGRRSSVCSLKAGGQGQSGGESSDLQTNGPLTARKGLVFNWPLSCRGHCEMTLTCRGLSFLPTKQVKSSCQWGGNGRNMALCPACSLGPWPSYWGAWPRSCCRELNSSCLESPLGTGAPLPGPSLKRRHQNLLHPRWHTGALFPGG